VVYCVIKKWIPRLDLTEESGYLGYIIVISVSIFLFGGTTYNSVILDKTSNKVDFNVFFLFFFFFLPIKKEFSVIYRSTAFIRVFFGQEQGVQRRLSTAQITFNLSLCIASSIVHLFQQSIYKFS